MSPRSTTRPLYVLYFVSNSAFFLNDICPSVRQNEPFCPSSLLHRSPLSYFWLSSGCTPESFPCTKRWCCNELSHFPATCSSWWFGKDSTIHILVGSLASKIHANFDLISLDLPSVTTCWLFLLVLQSIAGATSVSNFFRAFLMVSLNSLSSGSMK